MNIPSQILTMLAGIALTLISLWFGQHHGLLPVAASKEAELVDGLFNTMMVVSVGLFILVQGVILISLFKFRRRAGDDTDGPPIHGNIPLEIVWTAIPAVIVLVIGVYSFDVYKALGGFDPEAANDPGVAQVAMLAGDEFSTAILDPSQIKKHGHHHQMALGIGAFPEDEGRAADLIVDVKGIQYAWIFSYPGGITSGELHVPISKEVQLNLNAQDVLHAFWLPEFRLKQDAIPGRRTELRFKPERLGEYPVICAELCGPYHGGMVTKLYVEDQETFDTWVQTQLASQDNGEAIALNPLDRTDSEYLAPFVSDLGITAETLAQLNSQS
ncbi:MAG: cytochrome c oxidase subunit II [Leptolyngbyaceae cyanobacterium SL_7_1]|nr:cytochrome c oxidase subunit II [Leptolyngbyaceae cyanobacterium SL_7_1]